MTKRTPDSKKPSGSILEALADRSRKPDALGYQPLDQRMLKELGFNTIDKD